MRVKKEKNIMERVLTLQYEKISGIPQESQPTLSEPGLKPISDLVLSHTGRVGRGTKAGP